MENSQEQLKPRVGVGILVVKEGKILLGKRLGAHGAGTWSTPGGHLEYGESVEECAKRELLEETGLEAVSLKIGPWTNNVIDNKHYVTHFIFVDDFKGNLQLLEPQKCEGWQWFDCHQLPQPLFPTLHSLFEKIDSRVLEEITLSSVLSKVLNGYQEREWEQYHSPKNLVMNLACEIGELVEPFRWITEEQSYHLPEKALKEVRDEIGDVFQSLIYLAHKLGIDPVKATNEKLEKIFQKYPVEACKGKCLKYTAYKENN